MDKANLPLEKAQEPIEEAKQPVSKDTMSSNKKKRKHVAFTESSEATEISGSQNSSSYKEALSQPPPDLTMQERLLWLQKRRTPGLWAQCDDCDRWRFLPHVIDRHELPKKWYCRMNPDKSFANCSVPEVPLRVRDEEDLIHSEYSAGSVVWARFGNWPWWPAMVDDCPDTEDFFWLDGLSDIPTYYNVVFFDSEEVTRAWVLPRRMKPFSIHKNKFKNLLKDKRYKTRLTAAIKQADDANMLPLVDRLAKYSFISRYEGPITCRQKIDKKALNKFKNQLKRKLDVNVLDEDSNETDDDVTSVCEPKDHTPNKNVIILGTPKKAHRIKPKILSKAYIEVDGENTAANRSKNETSPDSNKKRQIATTDSMTVQLGSSECRQDSYNVSTMIPSSGRKDSVTKIVINSSPVQTSFETRIASPNSDDFDF